MESGMNAGAYLIKDNFFSPDDVGAIAALARDLGEKKTAVHQTGKYQALQWHQVALNPKDHPFVERIYSSLGANANGLCVFYYLSPGAVIHPHRDLTGASSNARIRFHVPVITNDKVFFEVSKKRVLMSPGEIWCLDTSYLHSVANRSDETRVHIVIECDINENVRKHLIPKSISTRIHDIYFFSLLSAAFFKSLFLNSWKDPKYFIAQMKMIRRFIGWRFLGESREGGL
jgi:Aspartyl/Asparaginyl beta-hydroxylase